MFVRLKNIGKYIFGTLVLLGIALAANARVPKDTDFGVWNDLSVMKKIQSNSLGLFGAFYTNDNSRSIDRISIGVKGERPVNHWLNAGVGYALMNFVHPGYNELRDRFYIQAEPFWHLSKFIFSFRQRMQLTLYPHSQTNASNTFHWRNRLEVCYRNPTLKMEPLADVESWYLFGNHNDNHFAEFRFILGANYHLTQYQKVKFYGMLTDGTILNRFILGISYELQL
jgi:hypothetical protein